jgi:fructokinase
MHIGLDLGRSKIAAICLDGQGTVQYETRIKTPPLYQDSVSAMAQLVQAIETKVQAACTVGIGTPGAISAQTGLMKNAGMFDNHALDVDLTEAMGRPIKIANDANCFALSEATDGAGQAASTVFGVILGSGVGGGIVVNGHILVGANAIAGEWGHNPLPWPMDNERPGPACFCGKNGCMETFLSGPALVRDHLLSTHQHCTAEDIAKAATPDTRATMTRYERRLARALAHVVNFLDPDVIVLGGGLSNIDHLYESVANLWTDFVTSDHIATRLVKAKFGDASGVRGAAWLGKPTI